MSQKNVVEHIFRHEYGRLLASLLRRVGCQHLQSAEDAVQHALLQALDFWVRQGLPDEPSAWLYQVAYRKLIADLRQAKRRQELLQFQPIRPEGSSCSATEPLLPGEMADSLLRMLFVACHEGIPTESQLVFTLKCLLGFSVREIALRLFISEANVYKRYGRAKQYLEKNSRILNDLSDAEAETRLAAVLNVIYLVFTEGYLSSHPDLAIRQDLCQESLRLARLLVVSKHGNRPETLALLALMHLHFAHLKARQDQHGTLVLLEQQDRGQWDQVQIRIGFDYLQRSAKGSSLSRFHIEAGIAAEHCLADSIATTRWDRIVASYELLENMTRSPLVALNKVIALSQWQGPEVGLKAFEGLEIPSWLALSYHWFAVKADLLRQCGREESSLAAAEQAINLAPSDEIKRLLSVRLRA